MIPAYSPQARGRSERSFGTWQGRLPQALRLRNLRTVEAANQFLREQYIADFNQRFRERRRNAAMHSCHAETAIWSGFSHCSSSAESAPRIHAPTDPHPKGSR